MKIRTAIKAKRFSLRAIILTAALTVLITLGAAALVIWNLLGEAGLAITAGTICINSRFVGEYDPDAMADAALGAMVDSLGDRWSYYMDAEGYEYLELRRDNAYVGIGVTVLYTTDGMRIQEVIEGGPAQAAGLLPGEVIVAVDGQDVTGDNVYNGTALIQGEEGTRVAITVQDAEGTARETVVIRGRIQSDPVSYEMLEGNVGYVSLDNFYRGTAGHVEAAVEDLLAQGAQALIFDVRNNPGGYLDEMLDLLDYLLPEGEIFRSGTRSGPNKVVKSDADCVDVPMAVLVNADSYSAAELFAAQLRESVGAPIVGQPTTGKGYSQQTFLLPGGRGINISTKTYYTGAGISLIGVGIVPDKVVELTGPEDEQLAAAVDCLP